MASLEITSVVFDLDDTLYPEIEFVHQGFYEVAKRLESLSGIERDYLYEKAVDFLEINGRGAVFDDLCLELELDASIDELVKCYRNTMPKLMLYEDANHFLNILKRSGVGLGLITDGNAKVQHRKVLSLGLYEQLDAVVLTDLLGVSKPSLIPFERILASLESEPSNSIYIGDNPKKDFVGARSFGMNTIRVIRPGTSFELLEAKDGYEADYVINDFSQLSIRNTDDGKCLLWINE